ncbi:MAG: UdgX family uracil-DNA binding protein, partial [Rariglobus sp.]
MPAAEIWFDGTFADWKRAAREALTAGITPDVARWIDRQSAQAEFSLGVEEPAAFALSSPPASAPTSRFRVPRDFVSLAADVACFRDETRWGLLYRVLWRLTHNEPHLLEVAIDPDVHGLRAMAKAIHRDIHKMRAFVRFREVATENGPWFVAWFEPQHLIVEANAPFFRDRFPNMRWSILTPDRCVHWQPGAAAPTFTAGARQEDAPTTDAGEKLWLTYYANIFNPARIKIGAMTAEMPRHYWKNLPEAKLIPSLLAESRPRVEAMVSQSVAQSAGRELFETPAGPVTDDLEVLRDAAVTCRACPLWRTATCTVFGEGPSRARIVVVGEQPGDQEDRAGKPFIGPAGQLLDRAFAAAGIDRDALYVTNAVKHFKWEPRGKRRLHQKPNSREIAACRPWLEAELKS